MVSSPHLTTYSTCTIEIPAEGEAEGSANLSGNERMNLFHANSSVQSSAEWPSLDGNGVNGTVLNDSSQQQHTSTSASDESDNNGDCHDHRDHEAVLLQRKDSLELLDPVHASPLRKSNIIIATFNLLATIVGGGVLSLPLSFEKAGIMNTTILMIISAFMTDFSLYILCSCSRRTGARSFAEVAKISFGPAMEAFTIILLFVFLIFVIIAYMVLVRDIWTPILKFLLQVCSKNHSVDASSQAGDNVVLLAIVVLMCPFLLKKDLHALRHNCYIGFTSILVLCLAMVKRAYDRISLPDADDVIIDLDRTINYTYTTFPDTLFAFPIITLSFLSSYNVISVHAALTDPTRKRVRTVIDSAVIACFVLMYIFGLAGYLCARSSVRGNILLNFPFDDRLILTGRVGCGITVALALPIVLLPCREALFDIITHLSKLTNTAHDKKKGEQSPLIQNINQPMDMLNNTNMIHIASTFSIITFCFICAVCAPGVATVWSICGSSMAFLIAFTLPTAFYIKIRGPRKGHFNKRILLSWFIFIFSILGASACTIQVIWRMFSANKHMD